MFINAEPFFGIIQSYRLLWFGGRFGGGKTSCAYAVAERFLKQGYRLVTNNLSIWADDPVQVKLDQDGHLKTVVLMDEGGVGGALKVSSQLEAIAAYAAKMDVIYIVPSFWPPCRAMKILSCQPLFSLKSAGLPVIVYRWRVRIDDFRDTGIFLWINPSPLYGVYSRQDPGARLDQIMQFLITRTNEFRRKYQHVGDLDSVSEVGSLPTEMAQLAEAVGGFQEAADLLASIPARGRSRRRF